MAPSVDSSTKIMDLLQVDYSTGCKTPTSVELVEARMGGEKGHKGDGREGRDGRSSEVGDTTRLSDVSEKIRDGR